MRRVIRCFGLVSGFLSLAEFALGQTIPEARQVPDAQPIANWPAPLLWTSPAARAPEEAHTEAATTASAPLPFIAITPCRVADTRGNGFTGAYGPPALVANATRSFTITAHCGIPVTAAAVSFNFAALNVGAAGDLRVFPAGGGVPLVSTLNYNANTPNIANAAVVPLGSGGAITVQADATTIDLIIDVNGYYGGPAFFGNNVFLGPFSGNAMMTGSSNTGVGLASLNGLTSGSFNTATGTEALRSDNTGSYNTAVGYLALEKISAELPTRGSAPLRPPPARPALP